MAHDPLLRWEWEGGAPAHLDWPDVDEPDVDEPDSGGADSGADEVPKGADVAGRDPRGHAANSAAALRPGR
jgi:hypothetical protein